MLIFSFTNQKLLAVKKKAVSWDFGACVQDDNISNDKVPNTDAVSGPLFASDDWHIFIFNELLKLNKSFVLDQISKGGDSNQKEGHDEYRDGLSNFINGFKSDGFHNTGEYG